MGDIVRYGNVSRSIQVMKHYESYERIICRLGKSNASARYLFYTTLLLLSGLCSIILITKLLEVVSNKKAQQCQDKIFALGEI